MKTIEDDNLSENSTPPPRSPRRRARESAVQALYEWRVGGQDEAAIEAHAQDADDFTRADPSLFKALVRGVLAHHETLRNDIIPHIDRGFDELSPVEASILMIGAYEFRFLPENPYRVILNECVELAKTFGGTDGHKFVNGVLDKLAPVIRPEEVAEFAAKRRQNKR